MFILTCLCSTMLFLFARDLNILEFLTFFLGPCPECFCVLTKQQVMVKKNPFASVFKLLISCLFASIQVPPGTTVILKPICAKFFLNSIYSLAG